MNDGTLRMEILTWAWIYGAFPLAWISVLLHALTPWRRSALGVHLMAYAVMLAVILTFVTVRHITREEFPDWLEWVRFGVYLAFPVILAWRVALQFQAAKSRRT